MKINAETQSRRISLAIDAAAGFTYSASIKASSDRLPVSRAKAMLLLQVATNARPEPEVEHGVVGEEDEHPSPFDHRSA